MLEAITLKGKKIIHVSCGGNHTGCITYEGYLYTWGLNKSGQLGLLDYKDRNEPCKVNKLSNYFALWIFCYFS